MMQRLLSFLFLLVALSLKVSAQFTSDGFYRVMNCGQQRYAYVTDNTGNYDMSRDVGDFSALQLWKGLDRAISNPGSVIYIKKVGANKYDLQSQHTGIYKLVSRYVDVQEVGNQLYTVSATESAGGMTVTKYLTDNESSDCEDGVVGTSGKLKYRQWKVIPISSSTDNYFGITPNVTAGGKYYYPFYADFAFAIPSNMKAYIVTKVDPELNLAVYSELKGTVPASTPVLLECASSQPTNNRIDPLISSANAPAANLMKGVYFFNTERMSVSSAATTLFNSWTMRVLGVTKEGKLGFVNSSANIPVYKGSEYLPANQAYLPVPRESGSELTLVTQEEYNQIADNRTYTLTYVLDGVVYKTEQLKPGEAISAESSPTREGYTFSGWSEVPSIMPSRDVTVTGSFTPNSYTLTYIVDGEVYKSISVTYGTSLIAEAAPTCDGYTFSGWSEVPATMPASDVTVIGSFSVNRYTLTYLLDGEVYKTSTVTYHSLLTPEADPVREGYTFSGWNEVPATMPAGDVTVIGSFSANSYTVTYMVQGGVYRTQQVTYGSTVVPIDPLQIEGFTFIEWLGVPATMPAQDVTITARYELTSYTVTYIVDGAIYQIVSVPYSSPLTPLEAPVREGYAFSGWSEMPESMPARDITVSGTFSICSYTLSYVLRGGGYNDEVYSASTYYYGASITPLTVAPVVPGYTFMGYDEVPATMPGHDVVIYGTYEGNAYTITYTVDGVEYRKEVVRYGDPIPSLDQPTKEGYTFSGWKNLPETMPAQDVYVYGNFTVNSYTLTYIFVYGSEGGTEVYRQSTVRYGTKISPVSLSLTKAGYTFHGWNKIPPTMPARDVTIYGNYEPNRYTVTYVVAGKVVHTESVAYGEKIPSYVYEPEENGVIFRGWTGATYATMPARDLTYTADLDDAIAPVIAETGQPAYVYDLQGQRVEKLTRSGIYIVDGKKVYIRKH